MAIIQEITGVGYTVEVVFESQFDIDILPHHPELKQLPIFQHTLNTRDALYGGRTEAMVPHYAICDGETIQYCDIMSLYPFVCKYSKFPIGHTKVLVIETCRVIQAMLYKEGLMKCTVLPPKRIYHPVLLFHCNTKLLFCLCKACVLECNISGECGRKVCNGNVRPFRRVTTSSILLKFMNMM
jgi:hypothetical protein